MASFLCRSFPCQHFPRRSLLTTQTLQRNDRQRNQNETQLHPPAGTRRLTMNRPKHPPPQIQMTWKLFLTTTGLVGCLITRAADTNPPPAQPATRAEFNVRDFGAKGDGLVKDTTAIQKVLDTCASGGGARPSRAQQHSNGGGWFLLTPLEVGIVLRQGRARSGTGRCQRLGSWRLRFSAKTEGAGNFELKRQAQRDPLLAAA